MSDDGRPPFDAWSIPDGIHPPPPTELPDEALCYLPYGVEWVSGLLMRLERAREDLLARPATELAETLGRVGGRFADPSDPLRQTALDLLPVSAGLSAPMAAQVVDGMARDWSMTHLRLALEAEFGDPRVLDGFVPDGPREVRAYARSPALHVCAGTVPGVTVTSMLRALMVKSAVLVKPGLGDHVLPVLFREGLAELDPSLAAACAVLYWPGREMNEIPPPVRSLVVYGDDSTISSLRQRAPASVRFVGYPHRLSFGLLGRDWLDRSDAAESVARTASLYERRGCVSPHHFYVEERKVGDALKLGQAVATALGKLGEVLPPPPTGVGDAALQRQWIQTLRMTQATDPNFRVFETSAHGVVVVGHPTQQVVPPGRVVVLRPVADLVDAVAEIETYGPHVQSVALEVDEERRGWLSEALVRAGSLRITTVDRLPWPPAWWHHDGRGGLAPLVDIVDREL